MPSPPDGRHAMTAVAIIVEYQTPDLLELCLASLRRFAPAVKPMVVEGTEGAQAHANGIEWARLKLSMSLSPPERVILLDTDCVIVSPLWYETLTEGRFMLIGGYWDRKGRAFLHANCLSMSWGLFSAVPSFQAQTGQQDTAWQATMRALESQWLIRVVGSRPNGRVTEYVDGHGIMLWRHLGRGTSFRPRSWEREMLRKIAAKLGSPRARKILSYQQDRQEFLRKGWEIVRG